MTTDILSSFAKPTFRFVGLGCVGFAMVASLASSTGESLDESGDGDVYLDDDGTPWSDLGDGVVGRLGAMAVDARDDALYVLHTLARQNEDDEGEVDNDADAPSNATITDRTLFRARADDNAASPVLDLTGTTDVRLLFPSPGLLVMAERSGRDELTLIDRSSLEVTASLPTTARYHGTRTSPSGRFVAVADNTDQNLPIHLIDTETLTIREMPHDGDWLEAMWAKGSDRLYAIACYEGSGVDAHCRILAWDVPTLAQKGYPVGADGFFDDPLLDVALPSTTYDDFLFSFTWVGVAPDDRHVVFPLISLTAGAEDTIDREEFLAILDVETATVTAVKNALGPVGFTPDSSTIVSYRDAVDGEGTDMLFIDVETRETEIVPVPTVSLPEFFVTRVGNFVLVANTYGSDELVLIDLDNNETTTLAGHEHQLRSFVVRDASAELYLVDDGLFRIDMVNGQANEIPLEYTPYHIARLPGADVLVIDDHTSKTLHVLAPGGLEYKTIAVR